MNKHKQRLGQAGENIARDLMKKKGFSVLAQNYKKTYGELDLVLVKENLISFVEVKTRVSSSFLSSSLINQKKISSIILTAKKFMAEYGLKSSDYVFRFDIALIHLVNSSFTVKYIENAFCGA